mmetsp:Transcript_16330/g.16055  ORF Transcript_16330/g.16055 Transcript_16330/m.16055 type:complete len:158 (+) Transcript_16330:137-610(+)|eukprot:CAMPEP_0196999410 /NCGR_PEP_ID=MMETSP1380-20130617/4599_1 /TAXON_ID=5936 /ORGANISM="Euplotes crassus, Strain CT5" /LENGTH=157 /DNA_ID=CAMNT_0042416331 /DNA_START=167 /DNA_END=640 /DNA_ORIENTATION=-
MNSDLSYQELMDLEFEKMFGYNFSTVNPLPEDEGINLLEDKTPDIVDIDYSSLDFEHIEVSLPVISKNVEFEPENKIKSLSELSSIDDTDADSTSPQTRIQVTSPKQKQNSRKRKRRVGNTEGISSNNPPSATKMFINSSGEPSIALRTRAGSRRRA